MTQNEVSEGKKLIAEFMELAYCTRHLYEGWYKNAEFNHRICGEGGLQYDSSWDWLMPVVEKIRKLRTVDEFIIKYDSVLGNSVSVFPALNDHHFSIFCNGYEMLDLVYKAVIEFIKWYNQNK